VQARAAFVAGLLAATLALLWPALQNGYPLLRFDSAGYVADALRLKFFEGRPLGYPLFLAVPARTGTMWTALVLQSLGTCLLALRLAIALVPRRGLVAGLCALGAALVLTSLAAHTSTLMPDLFTSWLFLGGALCLVATCRADIWLGAGACFVSLLVHSTHLPLAIASLALVWGARALARRTGSGSTIPASRLAVLALTLVLAIVTLLGLQHVFTRGGAPLTGHPAFLVSRLHSLGLLVPTLDRECAQHDWKLCAYRDALASRPASDSSWFLWNPASPFGAIGRFAAVPELREISNAGLRHFLPQVIAGALVGAWEQHWKVATLGGLDARPARGYVQSLDARLPEEALRASAARQVSGSLPRVVALPSVERELYIALWLAALAVAALCARRGRRDAAWLIAAALAFLALNALVVAVGTSAYGRYQGRVAWLLAYLVTLGVWLNLWPFTGSNPAAESVA
jgi:hypothetical protein